MKNTFLTFTLISICAVLCQAGVSGRVNVSDGIPPDRSGGLNASLDTSSARRLARTSPELSHPDLIAGLSWPATIGVSFAEWFPFAVDFLRYSWHFCFGGDCWCAPPQSHFQDYVWPCARSNYEFEAYFSRVLTKSVAFWVVWLLRVIACITSIRPDTITIGVILVIATMISLFTWDTNEDIAEHYRAVRATSISEPFGQAPTNVTCASLLGLPVLLLFRCIVHVRKATTSRFKSQVSWVQFVAVVVTVILFHGRAWTGASVQEIEGREFSHSIPVVNGTGVLNLLLVDFTDMSKKCWIKKARIVSLDADLDPPYTNITVQNDHVHFEVTNLGIGLERKGTIGLNYICKRALERVIVVETKSITLSGVVSGRRRLAAPSISMEEQTQNSRLFLVFLSVLTCAALCSVRACDAFVDGDREVLREDGNDLELPVMEG